MHLFIPHPKQRAFPFAIQPFNSTASGHPYFSDPLVPVMSYRYCITRSWPISHPFTDNHHSYLDNPSSFVVIIARSAVVLDGQETTRPKNIMV